MKAFVQSPRWCADGRPDPAHGRSLVLSLSARGRKWKCNAQWYVRTMRENRTFFPFPDRYGNNFSVRNLIYFDSKFKIIKVKL